MAPLLTSLFLLGLWSNAEPGTLVTFIFLLSTERPKRNSSAFILGWMASLAVVFTIAYNIVGGAKPPNGSMGESALAICEIVFGLFLIWVARHEWRRHDDQRTTSIPKGSGWTKHIGWKSALAAGFWEQPWTITIAAALVVVRVAPNALEALIAFLVFSVASTLTVGLAYGFFLRDPKQTETFLRDIESRVSRHGPKILAIAAAIASVAFMADGIWTLFTH